MRRPRVEILVRLGLGRGRAHVLTTDLSYEYVRINAEYTT
jgi:N-acetylglutamate synthase/N-acetylornithine aminotransferase